MKGLKAAQGAGGAMKGLRAAQGAGEGLRPAYCLTLLSETRRKSPESWKSFFSGALPLQLAGVGGY